MSFRVFIYYCVVWGAATAFLGWILGRVLTEGTAVVRDAAVKGMALGLLLALGLALVDAFAGGRPAVGALLARVLLALIIGAAGGLVGGFIGQYLYLWSDSKWSSLLVVGWTLTGLLIGAAPSMFDYLGGFLRKGERRGTNRKLRNGLIGGFVGGLVGGMLFLFLHNLWAGVFKDSDALSLWSPSATGFAALGACIGLSVATVQIVLREAWLRVEAGFRPGRQILLTRPETIIGRSEACDVGLFGDSAVEKKHAKIVREGDRWLLVDLGSQGGTLVNGQRIVGPTPLKRGDRIQVGASTLSFGVRKKEEAPPAAVPVLPGAV
jgi:hypothetical protein